MKPTGTKIPIFNLGAEIESLWDELQEAVLEVVRSGKFILGSQVKAFEAQVAEYLGVRHAIGCNSGTDALVISLRALGIGRGDEVITTPFTFVATAEAICLVGATPIFADIDPQTFNLDPALIEPAITQRTKAILPVHLFGRAAEMDPIRSVADRHGLKLIEDVAQAFGGRYRGKMLGTIGHVAAFSFFPTKNLGAFGDGGLIATDDDAIAAEARSLRTHGAAEKFQNEKIGYNSRLDEIQAAILRVKLPHVDQWNEGRRRAAQCYDRLLAEVPWVQTPASAETTDHVYHLYTVRIDGRNRDEVQNHLDRSGITARVYYPVPLHKLPAYADESLTLPNSEQAARQVLSLPIGSLLSDETIEQVADVLHSN